MLLSGCASPADPTTAPSGTAGTAAPATTTPGPTPTPRDELIVGIEGVTYKHEGVADEFLFEGAGEAEELLSTVEELTGTPRAGETIEGPYGGYWGTSYTWDGLKVIVTGEHADSMSVAITAPTIGGVSIVTEDGDLAVGSTREDAIAAGAREGWDAHSDGIADWFDIGKLEVPGTNSLVNPGEVGIMFVLLGLTGDTVTEIQSPGNDFSDI